MTETDIRQVERLIFQGLNPLIDAIVTLKQRQQQMESLLRSAPERRNEPAAIPDRNGDADTAGSRKGREER